MLSAVGHFKKKLYRSFHNQNLDPYPTACAGAPAPLGCRKGDVRRAARARGRNNSTLLTRPLGQASCRGPGCLDSRPAGTCLGFSGTDYFPSFPAAPQL